MTRNPAFWYPFWAVIALAAVIWFGTTDGRQTLTVGVIGPLTGPAATYGLSQRQGVKLAADQINAEGGINGRKLQLLFLDDTNEKVKAAEAGRDLIYRQNAVAIIGAITSDNTMNLQRLCEKARVPLLTAVSTNPFITRVNFSYSFRCLSDDNVQAQALAKYTVNTLNLRKMAILHDSNKYGSQGARTYMEFAGQLGQAVVANESYEAGTVNFRDQLERIRAANPDGLLIWGLVNESALATRQARELGLRIPFFGGDGMAPNAYLYMAGAAGDGTILTFPFDPNRGGESTRRFLQSYQQAFGQNPDSFAAHGFDGLMLIAQALKSSNGTGPSLREALARITEYQGVTGKGGFDPTGNETRSVQLARVQNGQFVPLNEGGTP